MVEIRNEGERFGRMLWLVLTQVLAATIDYQSIQQQALYYSDGVIIT
jgi:hypothetical protein